MAIKDETSEVEIGIILKAAGEKNEALRQVNTCKEQKRELHIFKETSSEDN